MKASSYNLDFFHENLNKRIGAVAQTVYTDVYNCLQRRLLYPSITILSEVFPLTISLYQEFGYNDISRFNDIILMLPWHIV